MNKAVLEFTEFNDLLPTYYTPVVPMIVTLRRTSLAKGQETAPVVRMLVMFRRTNLSLLSF